MERVNTTENKTYRINFAVFPQKALPDSASYHCLAGFLSKTQLHSEVFQYAGANTQHSDSLLSSDIRK